MSYKRNQISQPSEYKKTIEVNDLQSYDHDKYGSNQSVKFYFHGPAWKQLAEALKASDLPSHMMSYFMGGNIENKKVSIPGNFAFEHFISKYAQRLQGWEFKLGGQKVKFNFSDHDFLSFFIDGQPFNELGQRTAGVA
jgi:hypothetical protein